jgi:hypothetical protein
MIAFKSCQRCHGDLHVGKEDITCLQCGYELRDDQKQALRARINAARRPEMPVAA